MPRYFLELAYKGTAYSGFQSQENANSIQAEVEKAFTILQKDNVTLTGSSRTDTGVHAIQNFFHFDYDGIVKPHFAYKMNAILPADIVIRNLEKMADDAHCRFDALSREYHYHIYSHKDPFLKDRAFFFPYKLDQPKMQVAAAMIMEYHDFTSFSKRNTQVRNFHCGIEESSWEFEDKQLIYKVRANRFLRGMVRAMTATMLKVGRGKLSLDEFRSIIEAKDCTKASFAVPPQGLFLVKVKYPSSLFSDLSG